MKKLMITAFIMGFLLLPMSFYMVNLFLLAVSEILVIASGLWLFINNLKSN